MPSAHLPSSIGDACLARPSRSTVPSSDSTLGDDSIAVCPICRQLRGIDGKYFSNLLKSRRAMEVLAYTLAMSGGFCFRHATTSKSIQDARLDAQIAEAEHLIGQWLSRSSVQGELLQDVIFNARSRCPACTYLRRSEGRLLTRSLKLFEQTKPSREASSFCLLHLQALAERADPPIRRRVERAIRTRSKTILAVSVTDTYEADRHAVIRDLLCPLADDVEPISLEAPQCPICLRIQDSQTNWLRIATQCVALQQPAWIALPTCRKHLHLCLSRSDMGTQRAAIVNYLEANVRNIASNTGQPLAIGTKRRRRDKSRWFDSKHSFDTQISKPTSPAHGHISPCPGCASEEISALKAISSAMRRVATSRDDSDTISSLSGICLKHRLELLIHARDADMEHRLISALCKTLEQPRT